MSSLSDTEKLRIAKAFYHECWEARRRAVESSVKYNITEHLKHITSIIRNDPDDEVQIAAIIAIGELGNHQHIPILSQILQETPFADIREIAEESIKKIKTDPAL